MRKQKNALFIDLLLLLVVCILFSATDESAPGRIAATTVMAPVYRGRGDAVAPLCAVSWNASSLPMLLDELREKDVRITFAVSGLWAQENAALLRRMAEDGHEIASMGCDPAFDGKLSEVLDDLHAASSAIEAACGKKPTLYYSGTRKLNVSSRAAQKAGMAHVQCTVDLLCAKGGSKDILRRASQTAAKGSIILLQPTEALQGAMGELIALFQTKGLNVETVSGIL